ncbi:hypothetical protein [Acinetobacter baumannii]|uniref:hypothetical protein n=1 Tax=Acinetobacter baumannii TaxID=470 RepID=UPI000DCFB7A2|nr:hypothetical protein [Acinetobacter baumannii]
MKDYLENIKDILNEQIKNEVHNFEPKVSMDDDQNNLLAFAQNNNFELNVGHKQLSDLIIEELGWLNDDPDGIEAFEKAWERLKSEVELEILNSRKNLN